MGVDSFTVAPARQPRSTAEDPHAAEVRDLFVRYEPRLGKYLAQMVSDRSSAEDLLQDTFHDAFRAREQLGNVLNPEAWLFAIAHKRALNALRKRRRFQSAWRHLVVTRRLAAEPDYEIGALRDLLNRHLTADDRALLLLRYLYGFDGSELASMTGLSPAAIRQRLARARRRLLDASETSNEGR